MIDHLPRLSKWTSDWGVVVLTTFFYTTIVVRVTVACDKIATDPFIIRRKFQIHQFFFFISLFGTNRHRTMDSWKNYIITLKDSSTDADASGRQGLRQQDRWVDW